MTENILIDIEKQFSELTITFRANIPVEPSWTILFGPSGSGKTTVIRCLAGLDKPNRGEIRFGSEVWFDAKTTRPSQKRSVGISFQDYALFPHLSVENNIAFNLANIPENMRQIDFLIKLFQLESLRKRIPSTLSGGEKQRVALARSLARKPKLLLLDEPFSALDTTTRSSLRKELRSLLKGFGIPIVMVTHDRTEALTLGDRIIVMDEGRVLQDGAIHETFSRPNSKRSAEIVGVENVLPGTIVGTRKGLSHIDIKGKPWTAIAKGEVSGPVMVAVRAEDVLLGKPDDESGSARNRWIGTILSIENEDYVVRTTIDCGFLIDALVTREAWKDMNLSIGKKVGAAIKATAVHVFPHH